MKASGMERLINILKDQATNKLITDVIEVGDNEVNVVISTTADVKKISEMAIDIKERLGADSGKYIINYLDQYGTRFERI